MAPNNNNNNNNNNNTNNSANNLMPPPPLPNRNNISSSLKAGTASIILNKNSNQQSPTHQHHISSTSSGNTYGAGIGPNTINTANNSTEESPSLMKSFMHKMPNILHMRTKSLGGSSPTSNTTIPTSSNNNRGSLKLEQPISLSVSAASPNTSTNNSSTTAPTLNSNGSDSNGSQQGIVKSISSPSLKPTPTPGLSSSTSNPNISGIDASPLQQLNGSSSMNNVPGASYLQQHTHLYSKHLAFTFTNFSNVPGVLMNHLVHNDQSDTQQQKNDHSNKEGSLSRSNSESSNLSSTLSVTSTTSATISPSVSLTSIASSANTSGVGGTPPPPPAGFLEYKARAVSFPCYEGSPLQQVGFLPTAAQIQNGSLLAHSTSNPNLTHSNSGGQLNNPSGGSSGMTRSKSRDSGIAISSEKNNMFWKNTPYDPHYIYKYNVGEVMTYISNNTNSGITNTTGANNLLYHDVTIYYREKNRNGTGDVLKTLDPKQTGKTYTTKQPASSFPNSVFIRDKSMNGLIFHGTRIHTRHQKYDPINVLTHLNHYLQLYNMKVQKNFSLFYNVYRLHYDPTSGSLITGSPTNNTDLEEITLIAYPFIEYPYIDNSDERLSEKLTALPPRHPSNVVAESLFHFIYLESKGTFVFEANEMYCYGSYLFGKFDCRIFDNGGGVVSKKKVQPTTETTDNGTPTKKLDIAQTSSNFAEYTEVKRFFSRHQCNDICKDLNLLKHPSQMDYYRQVEQSIFKFLNHHILAAQQSYSNIDVSDNPAASSVIPFIWRDPFNSSGKSHKKGIQSPGSTNPTDTTPSPGNVSPSSTTPTSFSMTDLNKKQLPLTINYFQDQGKRSYMEDRIFFVNKSFEMFHGQRAAVLCVFDGHGGYECAEYLYQNFIYHLECYQSMIFNIHEPIFSRRDLLEYAFVKIDEQYREKVIEINRTAASIRKSVPSPRTTSGITACAGSTGCTVFITASEEEPNTYYITCANVGDSRAFMIHQSKIIPLSSDHKPFYEQERKRIEMFGSRVENNRVCGLAVSRTFGDYYAKNNLDSSNGGINIGLTQPLNPNTNLRKQPVVALPEVVKHKIHLEKPKKVIEKRKDEKDGKEIISSTVTPSLPTLIVLASDGLFDVMSNSDVADYIYKQYYHHRVKDFNLIAKNLVNYCIYNRNSTDNVSVIISSLHYLSPELM